MKILEMLGIETYKKECDRLADDNNRLARLLEIQKQVNQNLAADMVKMENDLELLREDSEQYIEKETEKRLLDLEKEYKNTLWNRSYNNGRMDAYAEMGIKNIEAHERGNILIRLEDGQILEMILGLEDVTSDKEAESDTEIEIEDLV